jgi:hypothetical protein
MSDGEMDQATLERYEREIAALLGTWAAGSVIKGVGIAAIGHRTGRREWMRFGRQTAAWGAIDAIIAGAGVLGRTRRGELTDAEATAKARSLRRLLIINAVADVGYIGLGAYLALHPKRSRGDGVAIIIQGSFLLVLDATYAKRISEVG